MSSIFLTAFSSLVMMASLQAASGEADAARQIREVEAGLVTAGKARDFDRVASYYAVNVDILEGHGEHVRGRATYLQHLQPLKKAPTFEVSRTPERVILSASGELGYVVGDYVHRYAMQPGQPVKVEQGDYVAIYHRDEKEGWQIVSEIQTPAKH